MNDRTSTVPPVRFIGPDDRMSLDDEKRPDVFATIRPVASEEVSAPAPPPPQQQRQQQQQTGTLGKRGSKQFLEQVWGGVMEKLRMKRDPAPEKKQQQQHHKDTPAPPQPPPPPGDRPSRDDVYANYRHLVDSGFFASHAIQSTRQPGPARPSTSAGHNHPSSPARAAPPPQWPLLQPPATPTRNHPSSPIHSPTSAASSRGTKRAVDPDDDDDEDHPKGHRKLRKTASAARDLAIPRVRSSSRLATARRSVSAANAPQREPNKLTKRVLGLHIPPPPRGSSARRDGGSETLGLKGPPSHDGGGSRSGAAAAAAVPSAGAGDRVLRSRRSAAEPLRVRPDANRGIPSVPDIPAKFTYGEDRENSGPWRGLRRNNAISFYNSTSRGDAAGR